MIRHSGATSCPHCRFVMADRALHERVPVTLVARDLRVSTRTVRKWMQRYRNHGLEGLLDRSSRPHHSPRRQVQPGPLLDHAVMRLLHAPPMEFGINRTAWKLGDIKDRLAKHGIVATPQSVRRTIAATGIRWRKARLTLTSSDPEYRTKVNAVRTTLSQLRDDEAFFSIDELGPVAIKMRAGRALTLPGVNRIVPQWQKSRGTIIVTAALDLARNQVVFLYSERKYTEELIRPIEALRSRYKGFRTLYLSWDAAPWHRSRRLAEYVSEANSLAADAAGPAIELKPLPKNAQFLNVIESVFSGLARAVLHNSNYATVDDAKASIGRYFDERNKPSWRTPSGRVRQSGAPSVSGALSANRIIARIRAGLSDRRTRLCAAYGLPG